MATDAELIARARECSDCLEWLENCAAECCSRVRFRLRADSWVDRLDAEFAVHLRLSPDSARYYSLHGARIESDVVYFPVECCLVSETVLEVTARCQALTPEGLCSLHHTGKPDACSGFTLETARDGSYWIPPRCLYGYKLRTMDDGSG